MARSRPQSALRYPLTGILGVDANVRVLRELAGHGGELAAPALVVRSGLAQSSVRTALIALEALRIVDVLGSGRARLFRLRRGHPLAAVLGALFRAEDERFEAVIDAIRAAAERCGAGIVAVWLYGSVARGKDRAASDVDIAVVADAKALPRIEEAMREELRGAEDALAFTASVVAVDADDVVRLSDGNDPWWAALVRDGMPVIGEPPDRVVAQLRRRLGRRKAS
jgi:predicted nucleotidyltransferase